MKRKPTGPKCRNLYAWRGSIWYERTIGGRRFRVSTKACYEGNPERRHWDEAAAFRDRYEDRKGIGRRELLGTCPRFGELVANYFASPKFLKLAATTQADRRSHLNPTRSLMRALASKRIDEITADTLIDWYEHEVQQHEARGRPWSVRTACRYLSTIAEVMKRGRRYLDGPLPTAEASERIGEVRRTAAGRNDAGDIRPIEDPGAIIRLIEAAETESPELATFTLCLLDAGLRKGEARALRWRHIAWGADEDDRRRHLIIEASRSRGATEDGTTKSGRRRRVGLSRRVRQALGSLYLSRRPTSLEELIFPDLSDPLLRTAWTRITRRADLPGIRWKDLRDTFASHLLTLGIPIQWVSRQLGHAGVSVSETHYARYIGQAGDEFLYVEPPRLETGEVPADLLAHLEKSPQSPHKGDPYSLPEFLQTREGREESPSKASASPVAASETTST